MADIEVPFLLDNIDVMRRAYSVLRRGPQSDEPGSASLVEELGVLAAAWRARTDEVSVDAASRLEQLAVALRGELPESAIAAARSQVGELSLALVAASHRVERADHAGEATEVEFVAPAEWPGNAWWRRGLVTSGGESFDPGLAVFAVVHVTDERQALEQSGIAFDAGTDGVFLINHAVGIDELLDVYGAVRQAVGPTAWIGVNALGGEPVAVVHDAVSRGFPSMFDGLWTDNAGIDEASVEQPTTYAELRSCWGGAYFGGVAFKYQRPVDDLGAAARASAGHVDVLTTSGSGTGSAPTAEKIEALVDAAPGLPVAIASGITPENVGTIAGRAHAVLVATGISRDFEHLDIDRVRALVDAAAGIGPRRPLS